MKRVNRHWCGRSVCVLSLLAPCAAADWPTDANTPLLIGDARGMDIQRHSIAVTNDQALWVAWQDSFCIGNLRLQRIGHAGQVLAPGGLVAQPDPTCGFINPPNLASSGLGVFLAHSFAALGDDFVQRFEHDGMLSWQSTMLDGETRTLADLHTLPDGDILVVSKSFDHFFVQRIDPAGNPEWENELVFSAFTAGGWLLDLVDDGDGGVFLFWDWHTTYRKTVRVTRITPDGQLAFPPFSPLIIGELEGHSRHTPPAMIADGQGGAYFVWTKGFESAATPAPILVQRIGHDGSLAFPMEGARVSLSPQRQFDPALQLDPFTGDLLIAWRDDLPTDGRLRVQRFSRTGLRLWGDSGVEVTPLDSLLGQFAPIWWDDTLVVPVTGPQGVNIHRISGSGVLSAPAQLISPAVPTRAIRATLVNDGFVVAWQTASTADGRLFAQRINRGGRLGDPACGLADFVPPFGTLDFFDAAAFLAAFSNFEEQADLVHDSAFNVFDLLAFLHAFSEGCD